MGVISRGMGAKATISSTTTSRPRSSVAGGPKARAHSIVSTNRCVAFPKQKERVAPIKGARTLELLHQTAQQGVRHTKGMTAKREARALGAEGSCRHGAKGEYT